MTQEAIVHWTPPHQLLEQVERAERGARLRLAAARAQALMNKDEGPSEHHAVDPGSCDHLVVGGVRCPSGELRIFSPEETGAHERAVFVPPGDYGLMVCGHGFGHAKDSGDNGSDRYELWLWPTDQLPQRRVLKNGLPVARGPAFAPG